MNLFIKFTSLGQFVRGTITQEYDSQQVGKVVFQTIQGLDDVLAGITLPSKDGRVRKTSDDSLVLGAYKEHGQLYAVICDGIGSVKNRTLKNKAKKDIVRAVQSLPYWLRYDKTLEGALVNANYALSEHIARYYKKLLVQGKHRPDEKELFQKFASYGRGITTATVALLQERGINLDYAYAGDSPLYLLTPQYATEATVRHRTPGSTTTLTNCVGRDTGYFASGNCRQYEPRTIYLGTSDGADIIFESAELLLRTGTNVLQPNEGLQRLYTAYQRALPNGQGREQQSATGFVNFIIEKALPYLAALKIYDDITLWVHIPAIRK